MSPPSTPPSQSARRLWWAEVVALTVAALLWCTSRTGWQIFDPRQTSWLNTGDWQVYYQAWAIYVRGPWTLQLGANPGLLYPEGLSLFYCAAIFWLCLIGKLLAPLFSGEFQLYGLWFLVCFVSQALTARWALAQAGLNGPARLAGALLVLVDPVVVTRMGHIALMTHAVVIAQLGLALRAARVPAEGARTARLSIAVALFSLGVEAYLSAQVLPLCLGVLTITWWRGARRWQAVALNLGTLLLGTVAMLWVAGAIPAGEVDRSAEGFGQFSSDLLALFNSHNTSRLVPSLPAGPRQGEGFAYLGVGAIALIPLALVGLGLGGRRALALLRDLGPVLVLVFLLAGYAWSSHVTMLGREVLNLEWAFSPFAALTSMFRTCGRFIWPLHYLLVLGIITLATKLLGGRWAATAALLVATGVQAWENIPHDAFVRPPDQPIGAAWKGTGQQYKHLAVVPVQVQWVCGYEDQAIWYLTRVAAQEHMSINSGNVGRVPRAAREACGAPFQGPLRPDTLYVVSPTHQQDPGLAGARCEVLDGFSVCRAP